jgi:hypothetical protein
MLSAKDHGVIEDLRRNFYEKVWSCEEEKEGGRVEGFHGVELSTVISIQFMNPLMYEFTHELYPRASSNIVSRALNREAMGW